MRIKLHLLFAGILMTGTAVAANAPQPISQYGLIQNAQNYSSNPFWNPNGPYNQRIPQPVYVQGADLNTGDCQRTVSTLIAAECGLRNNCVGVTLSDIRPTIILQLSRLPGHNFATSCAGFIDSEFNSYVSKYATAAPNAGTAFPGAPAPNAAANQPEFKIQNPYERKLPTWNGEPWMQEMLERKQELENLQSQNGAGTERIAKADFPTTAADLSFSDRMQNAAAGYAPYKGQSAYKQLNIESEEKYRERQFTYCQRRFGTTLATIDADLAAAKKCRTDGVKIADCKLQGTY